MDALLARLDLDHGARPFFWVDYASQPAEAQHSYWDFCDIAGRFVDGLVLARIVTGRQDGQAAEAALREFLWAQQDPDDGLFYNPDDEPNAEMSKYAPVAALPSAQRHIDLFCQRSPMLAMTTLLQLGDETMRPKLENMVRGLAAIAKHEGDEMSFPTYRWARTLKPEWATPQNVPEKWHGYRYALLTGLARYAEVSRDPAAIELAMGIARHYMRHGDVPADGRFRANTHSGGVLPVTVGIARLGIAFGHQDLVDWANRVYLWTRENTPEFGFLRDGLGLDGFFAGTCETCGLADFVHLAVLLSEAGVGNYWDDIERLARNQLLENQYSDAEAIRHTLPGISDRVLSMLVGGFECAAYPNDLLTWIGAEGCCIGGGIRALYLTWRAAMAAQGDETHIRMGISRSTEAVDVLGFEPWEGRVDVRVRARVRVPQHVQVRIPDYVAQADLKAFVDDAETTPTWSGDEVRFESLQPGQTISLRYPLPSTQRRYHIADKDYEADWLGNVVIDMRPPGKRHPIYRRRAWLESTPFGETHFDNPTGGNTNAITLW